MVVDNLRKEDESMVKFMETLGFTERKEAQTIIKNQQNFVVMPGANITDQQIADISKLGVVEQEALRLSLQKAIDEAEVVEDGEDNTE
jgi:hypothetical protein